MKKKNILLLTTVGGFIPQFEIENVKILKFLGFEIFYASDFTNTVYAPREDLMEELGIKRIQIDIKKSPFDLGAHKKVFAELSAIVKKYEIGCIHCHTPVGGFLGRMLGRRFGRKLKIIYTAHGFHFYQGAPAANWLFYPVERYLAKFTDALVTINREDFNRAKHWKMRDGGRVYQIPGVGIGEDRLYLSKEKQAEAAKTLRAELEIPRDAVILLSVGELNKNKNHEVVLKALAAEKRKDVHYLIAGAGALGKKLEEKTARLGLNQNVHFLGYQEAVAPLLGAADIFVFPSRREGLGMAALEAMAMGLPVVAADNRGTREYVIPGVNGYRCVWCDEKAFGAALDFLIRDRGKREEMGKAARKTAERFGAEKTARIMRRVYEETLGEVI